MYKYIAYTGCSRYIETVLNVYNIITRITYKSTAELIARATAALSACMHFAAVFDCASHVCEL